ncbi:MAG TPA: hypothetical protein VGB77_04530 [Abditibacteriaceae bacterium]|jgi:hypothetical protein
MAVTDVLPLDEFVDLYKMLDIAPGASEAELRERVNKLYLEAQRNIDHHNFRKRFYYQQLYEVHLPQAHQLLLDPTRRTEYNRFLDAFNKGEPFPEDLPDADGAGDQGGDLGRTSGIETDMLPTVGAVGNAVPGLATPSPAASPATSPAPGSPRPTPAPTAPAKPAPAPTTASPTAPAPVTPRRAAPASPSIASSAGRRSAVDIEDMERRRDHKRRELIRGELEAAGQMWGYGAGTLVFIVILAIAYFAGGGQPTILGGGAVLAITSALIAGRFALRAARRNVVVVLSKMPYDELLRRCAK